jgi:type IV pilus assembly protein PilC
MRFRFLAVDAYGKTVKGEVEADNRSSAVYDLEANGLRVTLVQFCEGRQFRKKSKLEAIRDSIFPRNRAGVAWKCMFFEQLSMLLGSGLPIEQALSALSIGGKDGKQSHDTIQLLKEKIFAGMSLSEGMMCCGMFSETEIKTIRAAEKIGRPAFALQKLADFGKKISCVRQKVKSALMYPTIVLTVACLAMVLLMTMVIPKFEMVFESHGSASPKFPWLTQKVMDLCHFLGNHFAAIIICLFLAVLMFKICLGRKFCREKIFAVCLKVPILNKLFLEMSLSNFFRTIGMLMSFGLPLQEAFTLSIGLIEQDSIKRSFSKVLQKIVNGENLASSFRSNSFLTTTDCGLISAGEQSGGLVKVFVNIAEIYDQKIESRLTLLTTLIEPAIIIFLAIVVGALVIAMFLPMVSVMQNISLR